jgi:nicotinamidase-related amidase
LYDNPEFWRLPLVNTAYLVLDLQNDFVHQDGAAESSPMGQEVRSRNVLANTARALAKARDAGALVVFVRVGFSDGYLECPAHSPLFGGAPKNGLLLANAWGTQIHEAVAPQPGEGTILKRRVSPFYGTDLEPLLRARGIDRIVASGVSTVAVVQATIRDAHDRDYRCIVMEDGCSAATREEHDQSIAMLRRFAAVETSETVSFRG